MNYELLFALGTSAGALVLAFLYARAANGAAQTEQYKGVAEAAQRSAADMAKVAAAKELYIRELEKTVIGSLPAGKLAERLNRMFAHASGRAPSTVPIAVRPTADAHDKLG